MENGFWFYSILAGWSTWQWAFLNFSQNFWSFDTLETPGSVSAVFAENEIWNRLKQFLPVCICKDSLFVKAPHLQQLSICKGSPIQRALHLRGLSIPKGFYSQVQLFIYNYLHSNSKWHETNCFLWNMIVRPHLIVQDILSCRCLRDPIKEEKIWSDCPIAAASWLGIGGPTLIIALEVSCNSGKKTE